MGICTASRHSACTITCSNGCIAVYYEPNGPCVTACSSDILSGNIPNIAISKDDRFSIAINALPAYMLANVFGIERAKRSEK